MTKKTLISKYIQNNKYINQSLVCEKSAKMAVRYKSCSCIITKIEIWADPTPISVYTKNQLSKLIRSWVNEDQSFKEGGPLFRGFWSYEANFHFTGTYTDTQLHMSHFAYTCKMRYPLNLVLEKSEYLWFYLTFCIVILDCGLKLHKLSNHALVMLQKWLEIH